MKNRRSYYVVNGALASGVLYYVLDLSSSGRTLIDWAVITLVVGAILFNLVQLGRRLHAFEGARAVWHLQRAVLFWIVGLLNTALLRPEDVGAWRPWVGWSLLVIAVLDTIALFRKERKSLDGVQSQA
jgi:hypothetical protein